jgi:hypothetical protein
MFVYAVNLELKISSTPFNGALKPSSKTNFHEPNEKEDWKNGSLTNEYIQVF